MLRLVILVVSLIMVTTNASAARFVCFNPTSKNVKGSAQGDCHELKLCSGYNNTGLNPNCIIATKQEFDKAQSKYTEYDANVVSGSRIVDMSASKIATIKGTQQTNYENFVKDDINNYLVSVKDLAKALVNLNLADTSGNPITGQMIKNEIKSNLGLN